MDPRSHHHHHHHHHQPYFHHHHSSRYPPNSHHPNPNPIPISYSGNSHHYHHHYQPPDPQHHRPPPPPLTPQPPPPLPPQHLPPPPPSSSVLHYARSPEFLPHAHLGNPNSSYPLQLEVGRPARHLLDFERDRDGRPGFNDRPTGRGYPNWPSRFVDERARVVPREGDRIGVPRHGPQFDRPGRDFHGVGNREREREMSMSEGVRVFSEKGGLYREGSHEGSRTPRKRLLRKKSVLLRIQKPGYKSSREDPRVHHSGSTRGKEEESPVQLDVSFKSDSLVAKAIVPPSSSSVGVSDSSLVPRSGKFRKVSVTGKEDGFRLSPSKHCGETVKSRDFMQAPKAASNLDGGLKQSSSKDGKGSAGGNVCDGGAAAGAASVLSGEKVERSGEDVLPHKVGNNAVPVKDSSGKSVKKKKVVKRVVKRVVNPSPSSSKMRPVKDCDESKGKDDGENHRPASSKPDSVIASSSEKILDCHEGGLIEGGILRRCEVEVSTKISGMNQDSGSLATPNAKRNQGQSISPVHGSSLEATKSGESGVNGNSLNDLVTSLCTQKDTTQCLDEFSSCDTEHVVGKEISHERGCSRAGSDSKGESSHTLTSENTQICETLATASSAAIVFDSSPSLIKQLDEKTVTNVDTSAVGDMNQGDQSDKNIDEEKVGNVMDFTDTSKVLELSIPGGHLVQNLEAPVAISTSVVDRVKHSKNDLIHLEQNMSSSNAIGHGINGSSLLIGHVQLGGSFSFIVPDDATKEDTCIVKRKRELIEAPHLDLSRSDSEVKDAHSDIAKPGNPAEWVDTTLRLSFKHSSRAESSVPANVCLQLCEEGTDDLPLSNPNDVSEPKYSTSSSIDLAPNESSPRNKKMKFLTSELELSCSESANAGQITSCVSELPICSRQTGLEEENTVSGNLLYGCQAEDFQDNLDSVMNFFEGGLNSRQKCIGIDGFAKPNRQTLRLSEMTTVQMTDATAIFVGASNQNSIELISGVGGKMNADDSGDKLVIGFSQSSLGSLPPDLKSLPGKAVEKDNYCSNSNHLVSILEYLPSFFLREYLPSVGGDGTSAANSGDELMDFAPDPGFDGSSPENLPSVSVSQLSQICVEKNCGDEKIVEKPSQICVDNSCGDEKIVKKSEPEDSLSVHASESLNNITLSSMVDFNHLANGNGVPMLRQDLKTSIPLKNGSSLDVLGRNTQPSQKVSSSYASNSGCAPRKPVSSTYNAKPRTWRRVDNSSSTSSGNNALSSNGLMQKQLHKNNRTKVTNTSYIRKGNSLVLKANPVIARSIVFPGSKQPTASSANEMKKSTGADLPNFVRSGGMSVAFERPKTPPLPIVPKVPNHGAGCMANHISSVAAEPHQKLSSEIPPLLTEITEKNHLPKSLEDVPRKEISAVQPDPANSLDCQSEQSGGNVVVSNAKSVTYVKHKSNQLVASSVLPASKASGNYYKRRKNQLIRTSMDGRGKLRSSINDVSSNQEGQAATNGISSINFKRLLGKVSTKAKKPSKFSLVWTLRGSQLSKSNHEKLLPQLFPWKWATYWRRNLTSGKWLLFRDRDIVYTKSKHGFSLQKLKGLGGSSLKWSKSMERHPKKASEKASLAVAIVQREKREQKGECIFRIGSVRYKMDSARRTLQRITDDDSSCSGSLQEDKDVQKPYVPRRLVIGKHEYVRIGNGNQLIRDPKRRARNLASEKVRWSLHTVRSRLSKKRKYCQFFTRFGKCNKSDGKCPYMHDPSKIVVCTKFLNGSCSNPDCKLTHKVIPERMPDCSYYLQGLCNNRNCPYRHVHVDPNAPTCERFLRGYCADGDECRKKHSYVCPIYEATGSCPSGSECKLHHPRNRSKGKKRKQLCERNSQARYFGSVHMNVHDSVVAVSGKRPTINCGHAFDGDMPDFISIYIGDEEEAMENGDLGDQQTNLSFNDSLDSQLSDLDSLIKPIRIMNIATDWQPVEANAR